MIGELYRKGADTSRCAIYQDLLSALEVSLSKDIQGCHPSDRKRRSLFIGTIGRFDRQDTGPPFFWQADIFGVRTHAQTCCRSENLVAGLEELHVRPHRFDFSGEFVPRDLFSHHSKQPHGQIHQRMQFSKHYIALCNGAGMYFDQDLVFFEGKLFNFFKLQHFRRSVLTIAFIYLSFIIILGATQLNEKNSKIRECCSTPPYFRYPFANCISPKSITFSRLEKFIIGEGPYFKPFPGKRYFQAYASVRFSHFSKFMPFHIFSSPHQQVHRLKIIVLSSLNLPQLAKTGFQREI